MELEFGRDKDNDQRCYVKEDVKDLGQRNSSSLMLCTVLPMQL